MQHAEHIPTRFPWRTATVIAGAIALLELVALIVIAAVQLAPTRHTPAKAKTKSDAAPAARVKPARHVASLPVKPLRPRTHVRVLVLNGNGIAGAAGAEADRLRGQGYRIAGAANAPRHDYARSLVMYVPGWAKEARRLAHDTGVRFVAPLDGLRRTQLRGSKIVVLLGS